MASGITRRTNIEAAGRPTSTLRRWRELVAPAALFCAALGLHALAGQNPEVVEHYYSRYFYLSVGREIAFVNKFFRFSLSEVLAVVVLGGLTGGLIWQARRLYLRRVKAPDLVFSCVRGALWVAGAGVMLFLLVWGLNYQRQPLAQSLNLEPRAVSGDELEAISRTIVSEVNRNYEEGRDGRELGARGIVPLGRAELYEVIEASFRRQAPLLGEASGGGFGPPKPVYVSRLMSRFSISGMYSPFTGEPNYNAEQPASDLPFSIAHEMAHQRGYAREDDANFIAFLICINSSHPSVRYSGHLRSMSVLGVLARFAPRRYNEVVASLAPGPLADIQASSSFWVRPEGHFNRATYGVTDAYLKINGVNSGLKNYNEVVRLIISYYLTRPAEEPLP